MSILRLFIEDHYFSRKADLLFGFFESQGLVDIMEMIIDQLGQENLPDLSVTSKRAYMSIKRGLKSISESEDYYEIEELVKELSRRLMLDYYRNSSLSVTDFMKLFKEAIYDAANEIGVDPNTIDGDMELDRFASKLRDIRPTYNSSPLAREKMDSDRSLQFLWNDEADLDYLKKVLVLEYGVFGSINDVDTLFKLEKHPVKCNEIRIHFLVYLWRQLCPNRANPAMLDGRIIHTSPIRTMWQTLATRLIKKDGSTWSHRTLKNYCSQVGSKADFKDMRNEVRSIVKKLESTMGFQCDDNIVTL